MENGNPTSLPQGSTLGRREWLLALIFAAASMALALGFCQRRGLFCDEYLTWNATIRTIPIMVQDRLAAGHSPLYFFWARLGPLLGSGEVAMRLTSAIPLFFAVLGLARLAGVLGLRRHLGAILAMALLAPNWFTDGTTYRYMIVLIVAALFVLAAAFRYAGEASPRRALALAGWLALALWIHTSAQFIALALLAFIVWEALIEPRPAGLVRRALGASGRVWPVGCAVLASLPLLYIIRDHSAYLKREMVNPDALGLNLLEVAFGDYQLWPRFFQVDDFPVLAVECAVLAAALWLARATLLAEGRGRVWRLIVCLLVVVPAGMGLSAVLVRNFQGPARYLTALSIPFILVMGVAWNAPMGRLGRWAFRGTLAGLLIFQLSATALDRGDRHREAIRFVINNHTLGDPILYSGIIPNRAALQFYGFQYVSSPAIVYLGKESDTRAIADFYARELAARTSKRGFFIVYYNKYDVVGAIHHLVADKTILDYRTWELSSFVTVGAFVRDAREKAWLAGLTGPEMLWGPDCAPKE